MPDSAFQLPLVFKTYDNQSLFSDHYLDEILQRNAAVWQPAVAQGTQFLAWLRDKYAQEKEQLPHYKEAQLEDNWFKPIFDHLGHVWEGQAAIPGLKGSTKKPDFAFFLDEDARKKAVTLQNSADYAQAAIGVGEVKQWGINLSKKTGKQPTFDDQNPMFQIDTYLNLTSLDWGILSNGRYWRLVNRSSSRTLETYFEIDLLAALEAPDEKKATAVAAYFWLFFNQASFCPDTHGQIFLNEAISQSRAYAIALEADLRDNAYRSLEQLIIGFFAGDQTLDKDNPADRDLVYKNSLYLLYRLLFLFYGESRGLLPMHNPTYKDDYSLQQLAKTIDKERSSIETKPVTGRKNWNRLGELCRLISGIDPQLNADLAVPRYNGGLFDPEQHPFLEQHFVGDRALAKAIDYLAVRRIIKAGGLPEYQTVDYSTLDVRQLGSIYEGLLEYKVVVAEEEMVTISQKGVETWVPLAQKGKAKSFGDRRQSGELFLTTDKGERKATGSYYTPDYIVEYIVENTLGPLVAQAREQVKTEVRQTGSLNAAERNRQSAVRFVAHILKLNVLDPAMGSGHFLVEATSYLARALATDDYVQAEPSSSGSDLLYWKRRVVEACIYGVDKNPMAVELAKLSLWLKTASADKPLSFLDHHLRHGDSLIGAWLADLAKPPRFLKTSEVSADQQAFFNESAFTLDAGLAVKGVAIIENLPTLDIDDVHAKEEAWRSIQKTHIARWQRLADLWVSAYFGNTTTPQEYRALAARLQGQESLMSEEQTAHFLTHPAVTDNDYFHWELAFPEVFFDEYGRSLHDAAGFDAVIGNPPWVNIGRESGNENIVGFLKNIFTSAEYQIDLYSLFLELSVTLSQENAFVGMIVPDPWLANYRTPKLRKLLLHDNQPLQILHTHRSAFPDVGAEHLIVLLQHTNIRLKTVDRGILHVTGQAEVTDKFPLSLITSHNDFVVYASSYVASVIQRIENSSTKLGQEFETIRGVGPYHHRKQSREIIETRAYHADYQKDETFVPTLQGEHLARYAIQWDGRSWISYGSWLAEPREKRFFQGKRLLLREIIGEKFLTNVLDEEFVVDRGIYVALQGNQTIDLHFVLALFASSLLIFWFKEKFSEKDELFPKLRVAHFNMLPIRIIGFSTSQDKRTDVVNTAKSYYGESNHLALLAWVDAELAANRNDTIHDLLAFLAEQMITLNKDKQTALEAFWLDLEGVTDAKTFDTLRNKGKQQASLHKVIPAAQPFVNADSRSSVGLDASLSWNEEAFKGFVKELVGSVSGLSKLVQVYRDHASGIAALEQHLTTTDHLIDQIVYKLYGLTEEEIAIVEGQA